jgi:hypothetical protein
VTRKRILRRRYGISEIHAELCAIDLPRAIGDSAGLNKALEAIDALAAPKARESVFRGTRVLLVANLMLEIVVSIRNYCGAWYAFD